MVRCVESDEPLVNVLNIHPRISAEPRYYQQRITGAVSHLRVRIGVARRLRKVVEHLPQNLGLLIWDAWRPFSVQAALYTAYERRLRKTSGLTGEKLAQYTRLFVSPPQKRPSAPHLTGGAVDLTLVTLEKEPIDMGTDFDCFEERAFTRYFEERAVSEQDEAIRANRRQLYYAMIDAGFTNYASEWWHYDFGDAFYGKITGTPAIYGYVE